MALPRFIFLTRANCGLCDQGWQVLAELGLSQQCEQQEVDTNLDLIRRFGDQVPVLATRNLKQCLRWPFDAQSVTVFVQEASE